jgi:serine phosphatase RsbU (regulator of sigma subunit)
LPLLAQPTIELTDQQVEVPISTSLAYFKDSTNSLTLTQVQQQPFQVVAQEEALNFGFSDYAYWLRLTVSNQSRQSEWFLYSQYPLLDSVFLYQPGQEPIVIGDHLPFSQRAVPNRFAVFRLLTNEQPQTIYLKVRTSSSVQLPFFITQKEHFYRSQNLSEIGYGIYYGILMVMIAYNLFLFISLRHIGYLAYCTTIVFNLIFFGAINGHLFEYWLGEHPWWANQIVPMSMSLLAFSVSSFATLFLNTAQYSRFWYRYFVAVISVSGLAFFAGLTVHYGIVIRLNAVLLAVSGFSMMFAGYTVWRRGNEAARFFILAWVSYVFGGLMLIFRNFGIFSAHNFITAHSVEIGNVMEVLLLSLALADQYNIMKKEKELAQRKLLLASQEKEELMTEQNKVLELRVTERTNDLKTLVENLNQTNEELSQTLEQSETQRQITEQKSIEVQKKNDNITSSLNYARRIQSGLLVSADRLAKVFGEQQFFVLYYPKDIVSGDFYWFSNTQGLHGQVILAVADCTGHGVPGAFMTVIGHNLLDQIVNKEKIFSPARILHELDTRLAQLFRGETADADKVQDGMDIALIKIDFSSRLITFAGAKRPLWVLAENAEWPTEYKGDKFPIGSSYFAQKVFTEQEVALQKGDTVYLFTDGYADQFGPSGKLTIRKFRALLGGMAAYPMDAHKQLLAQTFAQWKHEEPQTDDVLVVGVKF